MKTTAGAGEEASMTIQGSVCVCGGCPAQYVDVNKHSGSTFTFEELSAIYDSHN